MTPLSNAEGKFAIMEYDVKLYVGKTAVIDKDEIQVNDMIPKGRTNSFMWPEEKMATFTIHNSV